MVNPLMFNASQPFLLRTRPDGTRQVSWRMWVLIFVTPVLFLAAAALLAAESFLFVDGAEATEGEVVRVYEWDGWNPLDGDVIDYGPVFRYRFSDGEMTEASTGQSSPNWNFEIGSRHEILFDPDARGDVRLNNFETLWALPLTILAIGLATLVPALIGGWFVRRWQKRGRVPQAS